MAIAITCQCGRSFKAKDEHAGLRAKCPSCGAAISIPAEPTDTTFPVTHDAEAVETHEETRFGDTLNEIKAFLALITQLLQSRGGPVAAGEDRREYKVLTQKDKWFSGKFDPERLEQAVNAYAEQGWTVKGITTANIPGFGGNREELIVLMER